MYFPCPRISLPSPVGLHGPDQMRVQQCDPVSASVHCQLPVSQRLQDHRAQRRATQHLRQNHSVHRTGKARFRDERDRL